MVKRIGTRQILLVVPAILLRFALMGAGFHGDLYSVYWRSHLLAYHGTAIEHNQLLVHLVHAGWLALLRLFSLIPHGIWLHPFDDATGWRALAQHPWAPGILILLKLPYLAAELGALALLLSIIPEHRRTAVRAYWLWNPFLLYGIHLYGRYESFPVLFVVLSLVALYRRRPLAGFLALMGAVLMRFYAALLLPLFWWLAPRSGRERLVMTAGLVVPLLLVLAVQLAVSSSLPAFRDSAELASILTMPHRVFLFAAYVPLLQSDVIYLFPLALFLIYLAIAQAARPAGIDEIWRWSASVMYTMFALTYFHPQWLAWLVPLLAIQHSVRPRVGILTALMGIAMVVYTFQFPREASVLLFAPLAPHSFETWPHPMELLDRVRLGGVAVGTFRTLISAILLHLAWMARNDRPFSEDDAR
ncbi:hypothetical protein JXA88_07910 [Candidatus Fermentibacteria bacterium]|nr:hypothetical protein [Candidatus Fermentibacteria bacterium]